MKNENLGNRHKSYNQLIKLLLDPTFREIVKIEKKQLIDKNKTNYEAIRECKGTIRKYLFEMKLPVLWIEPIYAYIRDQDIKLPLDNGIDLEIGSQSLSQNSSILLVTKEGQLPAREANISIVISSRVSIDRLQRFIQDYSEEIKYWQKVLNLPPYNEMSWKQSELAFEIIKMKDEDQLTFAIISGKLSADKEPDSDEYEFLSDENNIKTLYYRYKKRFNLP